MKGRKKERKKEGGWGTKERKQYGKRKGQIRSREQGE